MMKKMRRFCLINKRYVRLFLVSLFVAILSHVFFIFEWMDGRFMAGPGDGVSQMLPFKQLLYDQYTQGNFFYAANFGMGGGTYSQLSYYFSTSIIFLLSVFVTFLLETIGIIDTPDLLYWANMLLPISIMRVTLIIIVTTFYFKYMKIKWIPAFVGAVLYGTSVIYFRHVTYWEFFADAMIWLPILLYGVEKIIRQNKISWFICAIAISMFDNFYFAYINLLLALIYIILRWFFPLVEDERSVIRQIKQYVLGGIAGFGISAVSFIPAVYGYVNNHRIPYEAVIPLLGIVDNPLLDGRIIVVPAFVLLCLFIMPFYKRKLFVFFASLTMLSILLHTSPMIGSVFNGFSAPQYRWEYFLALVGAGVAAVAIQHIASLRRKYIIIAIVVVLLLYSLAYSLDPFLRFPNWQAAYLVYAALATMAIFPSFTLRITKKPTLYLAIFLLAISLYTSNFYQYVKLSIAGDVRDTSLEWMQSDAYIGEEQMELLQKIEENETDDFYRIDWMVPTRNNTPIVQKFNGFSAYSSILNKHLLYFYLYDLEIDMGRESVSRYGTLGNRANLASMLAGKYYMAKRHDENIPYGFVKVYSTANYIVYENTNVLPFVRTAKKVYTQDSLNNQPAILKEHAMLDGIILPVMSEEETALPVPANLLKDISVKEKDASFKKGTLTVLEKQGGIDLMIPPSHSHGKDYYLSFELRRLNENKGFTLAVNEYTTSRKKNTSIYKTGVDTLTIRVAANDKIAIRLPKGEYNLADIQLFEESYDILETVKEDSEQQPEIPFTWSKNKVNIIYDNQKEDRYMTLPIPYEKGWKLYVNGKKQDVLPANYAFIGIELRDGMNEIKLVYYPPYFSLSLVISLFSSFMVIVLSRKNERRNPIIK